MPHPPAKPPETENLWRRFRDLGIGAVLFAALVQHYFEKIMNAAESLLKRVYKSWKASRDAAKKAKKSVQRVSASVKTAWNTLEDKRKWWRRR